MLMAGPAWAAPSCEVVFQYNQGPPGALLRHRVTLQLAAGERRAIGQNRLDFVRNTGTRPVILQLSGTPQLEVRLEQGQQDPDRRLGYYFGPRPVVLHSVDCPGEAHSGLSPEHGIPPLSAKLHADS
jgi:hypothetical protein